jgi:hypothetical protein
VQALQPNPANLASPLVSGGPNDPPKTGWSAVPPAAAPGDDFGQAPSDARLTIVPDTAVAVPPARHSLRVNVPSDAAVVLPLPGESKRSLFEPFIYTNEQFTKTGSGQTQGKLKKRCVFPLLRDSPRARGAQIRPGSEARNGQGRYAESTFLGGTICA